jgi:hypothetical protein
VYNVPPPGIDADAATLKDASDRESPPQSFYQLQANCARSAELAIRDGYKLIEVEVCLEFELSHRDVENTHWLSTSMTHPSGPFFLESCYCYAVSTITS